MEHQPIEQPSVSYEHTYHELTRFIWRHRIQTEAPFIDHDHLLQDRNPVSPRVLLDLITQTATYVHKGLIDQMIKAPGMLIYLNRHDRPVFERVALAKDS